MDFYFITLSDLVSVLEIRSFEMEARPRRFHLDDRVSIGLGCSSPLDLIEDLWFRKGKSFQHSRRVQGPAADQRLSPRHRVGRYPTSKYPFKIASLLRGIDVYLLILLIVVASSGLDSQLKVWNAETGELFHSIDCSPGTVSAPCHYLPLVDDQKHRLTCSAFVLVNTWKLAFQPHKVGIVATTGSNGGFTLHYLPKLEVATDAVKSPSSVPAKTAAKSSSSSPSSSTPSKPIPPLTVKTPNNAFTTCLAFVRLFFSSSAFFDSIIDCVYSSRATVIGWRSVIRMASSLSSM